MVALSHPPRPANGPSADGFLAQSYRPACWSACRLHFLQRPTSPSLACPSRLCSAACCHQQLPDITNHLSAELDPTYLPPRDIPSSFVCKARPDRECLWDASLSPLALAFRADCNQKPPAERRRRP